MRYKKSRRFEYSIYFTLIFICALPFAFALWLRRIFAPRMDKRNYGVIKRAREQASIVTPMIFSA